MASKECSKYHQTVRKLKPIPLAGELSDLLTDNLALLSINVDQASHENHHCCIKTNRNHNRHPERVSPSEFVTLQRLRSSALACRTSTTIKASRINSTLFNDLINNDAANKNKEKNETNDGAEVVLNKKAVECPAGSAVKHDGKYAGCVLKNLPFGKSAILLDRGPVRNLGSTPRGYTPYTSKSGCDVEPQNFDANTENYNIPCNVRQYDFENSAFSCLGPDVIKLTSSSSVPGTVQSNTGCLLDTSHQTPSSLKQIISFPGDAVDNAQLPEDLSDFILKYSQEYMTSIQSENGVSVRSRDSSISDGNDQTNFDSPLYRILVEDNCVSPLSAKSAPKCSPVLPRTAAQIPVVCEENQLETTASKDSSTFMFTQINRGRRELTTPRLAKNRLRSLINDNEMVEAWAWSCKCIQELEGGLCYRDEDGDSLLHIVILHMDIPKIYALVEQMLKADDICTQRAFDTPNAAFETPLYLAVQKNNLEVVAYLLEAGANPNHQTASPEQQTPLHFAASYGMTEIVEILCTFGKANVNMPNGIGRSPLLCAVKEHGVSRKTHLYINNSSTILCLLKYGANPLNTDLCGNNIFHYAVSNLDADLIEMFKSCIDEETITKLANKENMRGETPLGSLHGEPKQHDEKLRSNVFISLLRCGATVKSH